MDKVLFAGISGSLRKGSYNSALLRAVQKLLPEDTEMEIVSIAELPLYNGDRDKPLADERPATVEKFRAALAKADGLVICSPEYNYGLPGVLKNAIDWASRGEDSPLMKKPIALMGTTPGMWGTVRMQTAFLPLYLYMDMKPAYKPEILIAKAKEKFDDDLNLTDEKTKELISKKLELLRKLCLDESKK